MKNGEVCYRLSFSNEGIVLRKMSFLEPLHYLTTRKAEVLNSLIMKITVNENDINDILQTFR